MSTTITCDALVVGAGVVGIACARRLALAGLETILVERENAFGQGISSRNSEVIHAGVYYPAGSLKAALCIAGRDQLYDYIRSRGVDHRQVGKWIVATTPDQTSELALLQENARRNGAGELQFVSEKRLRAEESELGCISALESPKTGILDSHGLMSALLDDFLSAGGIVAYKSPVAWGVLHGRRIEVGLGDAERTVVKTRSLVNSAGLGACAVAASFDGFPSNALPQMFYAKGSYFSLQGKSPFGRLIYPIPEVGGLGVHVTLDLQGRARFGPDVEWIDSPDYTVSEARRERFARAIRSYWPGCSVDRLEPAFAGVRPKLSAPGAEAHDFLVQSEPTHGIPGLVNLFGIESPGLTSCLALADEVAARLEIE